MVMLRDIGGLLALTARLLARFWPQLLLIGALGYIARVLILEAAVGVGLKAPLGGMVTLSLAVLVKLLVVIAMFATLRPGLPALAALGSETPELAVTERKERVSNSLLAIAAAAILPFFAYYAAWGFLGDTVREYSRLALDRAPFGERIQIFELLRSRSLIAAVFACWLVRWLAKRASLRWPSPWLRLVIVAADASWIFIGLYALDKWKDDLISWIGAGAFLDTVEAGIAAFPRKHMRRQAELRWSSRSPTSIRRPRTCFFTPSSRSSGSSWPPLSTATTFRQDLPPLPQLPAPRRCANGWRISPPTSWGTTGRVTARSGPASERCLPQASGRCSPSSCFIVSPPGSPPGLGTAPPGILARTTSKPGSG